MVEAPPNSFHPQTASFGLGRRFRIFAILGIVSLCLRLQKRSSLALNQKLPFPDGNYLYPLIISAIFPSTPFMGELNTIQYREKLADIIF
jgi:hypothetical protein